MNKKGTLHRPYHLAEDAPMARELTRHPRARGKTARTKAAPPTPAKTRFILYNFAGQPVAHHLVDRTDLQPATAAGEPAVAHNIIIIDRSGSMRSGIKLLKDTLIKLLTLEEYARANLLVSLISYASKGDVQVHFKRVPIAEVMRPGSGYLKEVRKIHTAERTCMSQALTTAASLIEPGERTAITLHTDGYADDPSPAAEERSLLAACRQLRSRDVFLNTIAYTGDADFLLLARMANTLSGACVRAGDIKEVYNALHATSTRLSGATAPPLEEALPAGCDYQVFVSHSGRRVVGAAGPLRVCGLRAGDDAVVYRYRRVSPADHDGAGDYKAAPTAEPAYALARAQLAEGHLSTAKYALASTLDATLTDRHARALTNPQLAALAHDLDEAIFHPALARRHKVRDRVVVSDRLSVLEVTLLLAEYRDGLIVNRRHLQEHYARRGVKRVPGHRDKHSNIVKPSLRTKPLATSDYARVQSLEINHNAAVINLLLTQRVQLVRADDGTPVGEVAGVLLDNLTEYNNYTLVSDGEVNVPELRVKVSTPQAFAFLKERGVLAQEARAADRYDFRREYTVRLADRPLVPAGGTPADLDGVFEELAAIRVLTSLFGCCLKEEADGYAPEQVEELKRHYLSRNLYINFPTTTEYRDLQEALAAGTVDARVSYRVDIGNCEILNLGKLYSANEFLDRTYEAFNRETGDRLPGRPTCDLTLDETVRFGHKALSARTRVTGVDEFMRRLFDDFLGVEYNGSVAAVLGKVGADGLRRLLQERRNGGPVGRQELVDALGSAQERLRGYAERLYRENVCPLVFYIGSTGLLPDELQAKAETAEELSARYPNLQLSAEEREGTFFEVGNAIISVYAVNEYFSR
jgi:Mg-chelatase subunit ChlD